MLATVGWSMSLASMTWANWSMYHASNGRMAQVPAVYNLGQMQARPINCILVVGLACRIQLAYE